MLNFCKHSSLAAQLSHAVRNKIAMYIVASLAVAALLAMTACTSSDDPDEGGIIGTGVILRGAVNSSTFASLDVVEVKSSDGKFSELAIDSSNQFSATSLAGTGPWVLSARTNADLVIYGIAYSDGTRNINRFSDLSLRSWFARQSLDLDTEFNSAVQFTRLPSAAEYAETASSVFQLIEPVLVSYNVIGEDAISGDYLIDDQGIDAFLNRNTVLIENGLVSFLFTDPTTNTQSVTRSTLVLESEFRDNGTNSPTVPGPVRALGSAIDEIVLVWDPSADDIAVVAYQVVRDGALIATTPYPVYIDSGLLAVQPYSYEIIAIDGAGNASGPSLPKVASPLQMNGDALPPAPTLLIELATTGSTVQLLWAQSEIGRVVSFNVYRGADALSLDLLLRVTSNVATDRLVVDGESYCYQVAAVGGNGLESERSDVLCVSVNALGSTAGATNEPLVEWKVPDIDSLNCDQELTSVQMQQGITVIAAGCYSVPDTLEIGAGATLTLTKGTILKFAEATKLLVPQDATLTVNGTPANPVVMTGEFTLPGYWGGIEFQGSRSAGNLLKGAVVQYAGGTDTKAAINATMGASRFRMEDSLVRFNQNMAIKFNTIGVIIDKYTGNRITENDSVGLVSIDVMRSMVGNSEYTNNVDNVFFLTSRGYTDVNLSVPDLGIPLSWNGVKIERGSLTIEPGVEIRMVPGSLVDVDGSFKAVGTAQRPILMKGRLANQGSWRGLRLSGRGVKTISHVNMTYAGEDREDTGAIEVACTLESAANVSIDNIDITDSASWGIYIGGEGCSTDIGENITYFNNALGGINIP